MHFEDDDVEVAPPGLSVTTAAMETLNNDDTDSPDPSNEWEEEYPPGLVAASKCEKMEHDDGKLPPPLDSAPPAPPTGDDDADSGVVAPPGMIKRASMHTRAYVRGSCVDEELLLPPDTEIDLQSAATAPNVSAPSLSKFDVLNMSSGSVLSRAKRDFRAKQSPLRPKGSASSNARSLAKEEAARAAALRWSRPRSATPCRTR